MNQKHEDNEIEKSTSLGKGTPSGSDFKGVPCAIYTRVSTDEQARPEHYSLDAQESFAMNEIKLKHAEGWFHKITIVDDGYSGAMYDRPGFIKMMDMVRRGEISVIIAYLRDRLWRDKSIAASAEKILDKHGVAILTKEGMHDGSPHSKFYTAVIDANSQLNRAATRMRVNDSMRFAAKKGDWKAGAPSFGYRYIPGEKTLQIHEEEAKIVRLVFDRAVEGVATADIARELKTKNLYGRIKTPRRAGH